ncbi:MAG: hypothetical protein ACXWC0_16010 [Burkholderiales bacterium]
MFKDITAYRVGENEQGVKRADTRRHALWRASNLGTPRGYWKIWTPSAPAQNEMYLACRALGELKPSLHERGFWHIAFSPEFFESKFNAPKPSRFMDEWPRPPEIAPGFTLAFRIIVPWLAPTWHGEPQASNCGIK